MNPQTLPKKVLNFIQKERLWSSGQKLLLSVSGGLDSMVMLDILARNQGAHKADMAVISFDHGVRSESAEETAFVAQVASTHGLVCHRVSLQLQKSSHFQEIARKQRQAYWQRYPDHLIATAHHGTDQAETMLFRFLRGTGLTGLRGMLPRQGQKVHPLLFAFREDLERYAVHHQLEWREDPSNAESWRGKVREIEPVLDDLRPNSMQSIARLGRVLARDEDCLQQIVDRVLQRLSSDGKIDYTAFRQEHVGIQARILCRLAEQQGIVLSSSVVDDILTWAPSNGQRLTLSKGFEIRYLDGQIFLKQGRS